MSIHCGLYRDETLGDQTVPYVSDPIRSESPSREEDLRRKGRSARGEAPPEGGESEPNQGLGVYQMLLVLLSSKKTVVKLSSLLALSLIQTVTVRLSLVSVPLSR